MRSVIVIITVAVSALPVLGCSCREHIPAPLEAAQRGFRQSDAVIDATVVSHESMEWKSWVRTAKGREEISESAVRYIVNPHRVYKGPHQPVFAIHSDMTTCGIYFRMGHRYLIYASHRPGSNELWTNQCTRTATIETADADLRRDEHPVYSDVSHWNGEPRQAVAQLCGILRDGTGAPLAEAIVSAWSDRRSPIESAITDSSGRFQMAVKPGEYRISAVRFGSPEINRSHDDPWWLGVYPSGFDLSRARPVGVKGPQARCDMTFDAPLVSTFAIEGRVYADVPTPPIVVSLSAMLSPVGIWRSTRTQSDGSFNIRGLIAGKYFLMASDEAMTYHGKAELILDGTRDDIKVLLRRFE